MANTLRNAAIGTAAALAVSATVYFYSGDKEEIASGSPPDFPDVLMVERISWEGVTDERIVAVSQRRFDSLAWLAEMRKDIPDSAKASAFRESFVAQKGAQGTPVAPPFVRGVIPWTGEDYEIEEAPLLIIPVDELFDTFALWAQRVAEEQPAQVVIGWGELSNFEKRDISRYDDYMRQIRAVVRMVREVSPRTFIWITVCYATPTYKPWMEQMGGLGDGISAWNCAYFGAVENFPATRKRISDDAGDKPVMLLGFFGYKCFEAGAVKPPDFEKRMAQAEQAARDAGFAGFLEVRK